MLYTSLFLKVNASSIKYLTQIDFPHEIDSENPRNRVQLMDERLDIYLMKAEPGKHWDKIQVDDMTKEELTKRRDEAQQAHYKRE